MGRSFCVSCSCRLMVCVEMTAFFLLRHGVEDGGHQVSQALADARAGLDRQVLAVGQRLRHGHRHLLLLRAELEVLRPGQDALRGEDFRDLLDEVLG